MGHPDHIYLGLKGSLVAESVALYAPVAFFVLVMVELFHQVTPGVNYLHSYP
jgi:hypothetical protein